MLFFVTVNYHSTELIFHLVNSLFKYANIEYQLIIVNNSPEDRSIHKFKDDRTIILDAKQNQGFGAGCNIGIQYIYSLDKNAKIWLINPDATIEPNAVEYTSQCFDRHPELAILGTKIGDNRGNIWFDRGEFNPWTGYLKHETIAEKQKSIESNTLITDSRWVCGCSLIINLAKFNHCPLFDPEYFLYSEDVDFCERYYQQKYPIAITNAVLVKHQVSAIIGKDQTFMFENYTHGRLLLLSKHGTIFAFIIYLLYLIVIILITLFTTRDRAIGRWQGLKKFIQTRNIIK
jgi:N-acetylglucosaminyl-diphospho-decaprenol L-rhamnosyltransferase